MSHPLSTLVRMDVATIRTLISAAPLADVAACRAELAAITSVRGLLDAREVEVIRLLDGFATADPALFPQEVVATATRSSLSAAERLRDRAATAADVPELGAALAAGSTTGDRVDVVARAAAGLSASERAALAGHGARLALAAGSQTATAFRKTVDDVVRKVRADDGLEKLARQRRRARLRWWVDGEGMWNLAGTLTRSPGCGWKAGCATRSNADALVGYQPRRPPTRWNDNSSWPRSRWSACCVPARRRNTSGATTAQRTVRVTETPRRLAMPRRGRARPRRTRRCRHHHGRLRDPAAGRLCPT